MRGKLQHHLHIFIIFLVERSDVIENISIHWHRFFGGAEFMGGSRIIENTWVSINFHFCFRWSGERGKIQHHWEHMDFYTFSSLL